MKWIEKINEKRKNYILYIALTITLVGFGYTMFGQGFDFNIYHSFSGDSMFGVTLVKSIQENGFSGIWFNDRIGAPEKSSLIDYSVLGNMMVILIYLISRFIKSPAAILYTYVILSFVLDGISMAMLLRKLKIKRNVTYAISILFACSPFHYFRAVVHSSLINYMFIPLAIYLSLYILGIIDDKKWKIAIIGIVIGMGYGYYYAFGLLIVMFAIIIKFFQSDYKKDIFHYLWVPFTILITVLVFFIPKILYILYNGGNAYAGVRAWGEQEVYGLKLIQLLLPVSYSRVGLLQKISTIYNTNSPIVNENISSSLGMIGTIGFIILCVEFFAFVAGKKENEDSMLVKFLFTETLAFLLTCSIGGFGELFNWLVTPQIRCYNRSSIVILAFSLIIVAVYLNKLKKIRLIYALCIIVLGVGIYDQVNISTANWQESIREEQEDYMVFFTEVEEKLPSHAMVYQLPYMDFPETGHIHELYDYEHFLGYLMTDSLRWSYGGVKGRDEAAKKLLCDNGMSYRFLSKIKEAGFDAVYIDTDGYINNADELLAFYADLDIEPFVSENEKIYIYDISNLDIDKNWWDPAYVIVKKWTQKCNVEVDSDKINSVLRGLYYQSQRTADVVWGWFENNDIVQNGTNEEYILFLYDQILARKPSKADLRFWVNSLHDGMPRELVLTVFLQTTELRSRMKFDDIVEEEYY